jgi:hypothetical protein
MNRSDIEPFPARAPSGHHPPSRGRPGGWIGVRCRSTAEEGHLRGLPEMAAPFRRACKARGQLAVLTEQPIARVSRARPAWGAGRQSARQSSAGASGYPPSMRGSGRGDLMTAPHSPGNGAARVLWARMELIRVGESFGHRAPGGQFRTPCNIFSDPDTACEKHPSRVGATPHDPHASARTRHASETICGDGGAVGEAIPPTARGYVVSTAARRDPGG